MHRTLTLTATAALSSLALAQAPCTIQETGILQAGPPVDNFFTTPFPLGFTFTFNGTAYDEIYASEMIPWSLT